jgi:hypothetical protein
MDNNIVTFLNKKYASGRKIPRNIVGKGTIKELLQIRGPGRGEDFEDQGSTDEWTGRRRNSPSPNLKYCLSRIHVGSGQLAGSQMQRQLNNDGKNGSTEDAHQGTLGLNRNQCKGPQ